ncbi:hypothetical protein MMPV_007672 [Pyropia vietnamensis]
MASTASGPTAVAPPPSLSKDAGGLRVLFLCTGNSCRSHMAEAWARHHHTNGTFSSAGMRPSGKVNPNAAAVMAEKGIDLSGHRSQHLVEAFTSKGVPLDYVVTVCGNADEDCPMFHKGDPEGVYGRTRIVHVGFDDPPELASGLQGEAALDVYRRVRDEIEEFVKGMIEQLPTLPYR